MGLPLRCSRAALALAQSIGPTSEIYSTLPTAGARRAPDPAAFCVMNAAFERPHITNVQIRCNTGLVLPMILRGVSHTRFIVRLRSG